MENQNTIEQLKALGLDETNFKTLNDALESLMPCTCDRCLAPNDSSNRNPLSDIMDQVSSALLKDRPDKLKEFNALRQQKNESDHNQKQALIDTIIILKGKITSLKKVLVNGGILKKSNAVSSN